MHITILALGSRGDVQPYAVLGQGLTRAGHQVRFVTFEGFATLVAEHDLDFHPVQGDARALVARAGADMLRLARSFGSVAEGYARDLSAPHLGETDLILNQLPAGVYGYDLAERYGVPMALAAVIPLVRTGTFPLVGFPRLPFPGYNQATYYLGKQIAWQILRAAINRWRKGTLGLAPLPLLGFSGRLGTRQIPILNGFSEHVVARPADWDEHVHITGHWFADDGGWQPPADLQAFLDGGTRPVFVGFGSMPVEDPQQTTAIVVKALRQTGQRGILHSGWGGLGREPLPTFIFKLDYAPYGWLFPRLAMAVHHGGSGTTAFGLRAGLPSCAVPFVFDQFYWGRRIAALGVGPAPIRFKDLSVARLAAAIEQGVHDDQMQQRAGELGKKIRAEDGIGRARRILEQTALRGTP